MTCSNLLVGLNSKLKLVFTLAILVLCGLTSSLQICNLLLIILAIFIILLPHKKSFIRRFVLFLPFIVVTFALPLFFTPGRIIAYSITYEGLHKGTILGAKVLLAIGYSLIFILSTPPIELAKSLDWITLHKLRLGETLLIALKFADLVKSGRKDSITSTLKYAIESIQKQMGNDK
ncbi:MAG: hypothetical protein HY769_04055 [Candidatus Stahlbacteria bacterium]|nr:hypothetical protein [Candidatus Stahlbacteria bacterium]